MRGRLLLVVLWGLGILAGCGGDVTNDPAYHFASMAGSRWKLKTPIALGGKGSSDNICTERYASEFAAGTADLGKFSGSAEFPVVGILPSGTIVRVDRLEHRGGDFGGYYVTLVVETGKYTGKTIVAPEQLFIPNEFMDVHKAPTKTWAVNPDNLEKP